MAKKVAAPKAESAPKQPAPRSKISSNLGASFHHSEREAIESYAKKKGIPVSRILRESALKAVGITCAPRSPGRPRTVAAKK